VKLLPDECIDGRLARDFSGHDVKTVPQMGWAGIKNGELLALAETDFDVFITVDRNLSFQQNLPKFNIAVLVLHAPSNRLADLRLLIPKIFSILPTLTKDKAQHVDI
jgi:predicted nuclease of predicted toxin-antitoxin system